MAKKKQKPWGIDEPVVKKEAAKAMNAKAVDIKGKRKLIKVYEETHRQIKLMAFESGMTMNDYIEHIVNENWKSRPK